MVPRYRFAFDTGGTFTDLVLLAEETGRVYAGKVLTTTDHPARGVLQGLAQLLEQATVDPGCSEVRVFGATTLVANTLIERKGARTALLTTRGFRDVLEIGREMRYDLYDLQIEFPEPLAPRDLRHEITERVGHDGAVIIPLDREQAREVIRELAQHAVQSVAVCFLHAYKNPCHEEEVARLISEEFPQVAITLSSDLIREIREYERSSTTVANAYVKPLLAAYVAEIKEGLARKEVSSEPCFMMSSGAIVSGTIAERWPIRLVESGGAAGVLAAAFYGRQAGLSNLLAFDMGGTTAKIGLISGGRAATTTTFEAARVHRLRKGSGLSLRVPVIDVIEIGAGGGSMARIDRLGLLKVGPGSAGAKPGPACYNLGGHEPTVTDANVVLGFLDPSYFLGGRLRLESHLAAQAIATRVAAPLGIDVETAAAGIYNVVNEHMIKAAKVHVAERGKDPRTLILVATGGAAPLHARMVANGLGITKILVPPRAGVASAVGILAAPIAIDMVRSYVTALDRVDWPTLAHLYTEMEQEAVALLEKMGVPADQVTVERSADMRYAGQGYEIPVPLEIREFGPYSEGILEQAFVRSYETLFERPIEGMRIEAVNWRVLASGPSPSVRMEALIEPTVSGPKAEKGRRAVFFPEAGTFLDTPVYDRQALRRGDRLVGPAVVEDVESTTIVGPGERLTVDDHFDLLIEL